MPTIDHKSERIARKVRGDEKVHERLYTKSKERMSKALMKEMMS